MRNTAAAGFTLIEMLLVIAILTLLLGILLPALSHARAVARSAMCLTQERQIADGFHMLADSQGGVLPGIEEDEAWDVLVQEKLDTDETIFVCPSDDDALEASADGFPGLSYGWREWFEVDLDESSLSGRLLASADPGLILVFEDLPDRHAEDRINAATVDGSARVYTLDEYEANMALLVQ